jgi:hypothetical protein
MKMGNIHDFPEDVKQLSEYHPNVKMAVIASCECTNTSKSQPKTCEPGTSGLHAPPSTTHHPFYEGLSLLQKFRGITNVFMFSEFPACRSQVDELLITRQLGKPLMVDAKLWGDADRNRSFRSNPRIEKQSIIPELYARRDPFRLIAGRLKWSPPVNVLQAGQNVPVVLRRFYVVLLEILAFRKRELTPFEKLTLDSMLVTDVRTGHVQFAGVDFILDHLTLYDTPIDRIKYAFPCMQKINKWGVQCQGNDEPHACGQQLLCQNCSRCVTILCGGWHFRSATETMYQALIKAMHHWTQVGVAEWKTYAEPIHRCSDQCCQRPSWAKGKVDAR